MTSPRFVSCWATFSPSYDATLTSASDMAVAEARLNGFVLLSLLHNFNTVPPLQTHYSHHLIRLLLESCPIFLLLEDQVDAMAMLKLISLNLIYLHILYALVIRVKLHVMIILSDLFTFFALLPWNLLLSVDNKWLWMGAAYGSVRCLLCYLSDPSGLPGQWSCETGSLCQWSLW